MPLKIIRSCGMHTINKTQFITKLESRADTTSLRKFIEESLCTFLLERRFLMVGQS